MKMKLRFRLCCTTTTGLLLFLSLCSYGEEIRVITEHSPPGEYLDETGRVTGATAEMVRELMRRQKLTGEIRIYPWKRAYEMALTLPGIALFETTRTEQRENLFKWVGPIKQIRWGLYGKKNAGIKLNTLEDAKRIGSICAYYGDSKGEHLKKLGFDNLREPMLSIQCLKLLMIDRVNLWISSDIGQAPLFAEAGVDPAELELLYVIGNKYLYIAFSKDTPDEIIESWQKTLDEMKTDGSFANHYLGTYPEDMIKALSVPGQPQLPWQAQK